MARIDNLTTNLIEDKTFSNLGYYIPIKNTAYVADFICSFPIKSLIKYLAELYDESILRKTCVSENQPIIILRKDENTKMINLIIQSNKKYVQEISEKEVKEIFAKALSKGCKVYDFKSYCLYF